MGFQKIIESAVYQTDIDRVVTAILSKSDSDDTEATIASVFENELYHFIKVQFSLDIKFSKESGKNYFRHRFQGRIDAISNGFVIEYKRQAKLSNAEDQKKAVKQLGDYLDQLDTHGTQCDGLVTDGRRACFVFWSNGERKATSFSTISRASVDKIVRYLIGSEEKLFSSENILRDFTIKDTSNPTYRLSQLLFEGLVTTPSARTSMLYEEWLALFRLSETDAGKNKDIVARRKVLSEFFSRDVSANDLDYKALYALQTTYAVVVKLIACKVIGKLAYNGDIQYFEDLTRVDSHKLFDFLEKLEDGYIYSSGGIRNLLEGDFFSWYLSDAQRTPALAAPIKEIVSQVELYSVVSCGRMETLDVFKDLYMDFIPVEVRHSLGEYYTPDWLADHIIEQAIVRCGKTDSWTGIDPCCGSGVFVLGMIDKILKRVDPSELGDLERRQLLRDVLTRVAGIDINPLSALTTRVNYFLAIAELVKPGDEIEIPVYVGDAAVLPQEQLIDGVECYTYTVETTRKRIKAVLPASFVRSESFLTTMNGIQTYVRTDNPSVLFDELCRNINEDELSEGVKTAIHGFADDLVELHKNDWDGIWVRIVSNFMLVARIAERDIIVGNPPWIKWEYLPEQYALRLKEACFEREMFSGQSYMGAISLNICAAIAIVTASAWLTANGVLAFLMPTNLLTQDSYEGFRNFKLSTDKHSDSETASNRLYLQCVEQWKRAGKLFGKSSVEPCASFYYQRNFVQYDKGVPVIEFVKKKGADWTGLLNWSQAKGCFEEKRHIAVQIDSRRTGYTIIPDDKKSLISKFQAIVGEASYRGRTGVEFVPDEVTFLQPIRPGDKDGEWIFQSPELKASMHKPISHEPFALETELVRPLLRAPEIGDFVIKSSNMCCLFPYVAQETTSCSIERLISIAPKTGQYLLSHKSLFVQQSERSKRLTRGDDFYALSKVGKYTFAKHMVVIRDNTRMCASVVCPVELPWGGSAMPIPAKHAAIIATHANRQESFISEEEAFYIAGIFNTPVIREWFATTFSGRSYSIKFGFKLPLYDSEEKLCTAIAELSREAHKYASEGKPVASFEQTIEGHYLKLCGYEA